MFWSVCYASHVKSDNSRQLCLDKLTISIEYIFYTTECQYIASYRAQLRLDSRYLCRDSMFACSYVCNRAATNQMMQLKNSCNSFLHNLISAETLMSFFYMLMLWLEATTPCCLQKHTSTCELHAGRLPSLMPNAFFSCPKQ